MTSLLPPGSLAPEFQLVSHLDGSVIHLREVLQESKALLVFYPGDFAPT